MNNQDKDFLALQEEVQGQRQDIGKLKSALIHAYTLLHGHHKWLRATGTPFDTVDFIQSYSWMHAYLFEPQPGDANYISVQENEVERELLSRPVRARKHFSPKPKINKEEV